MDYFQKKLKNFERFQINRVQPYIMNESDISITDIGCYICLIAILMSIINLILPELGLASLTLLTILVHGIYVIIKNLIKGLL